MRVIQMIMHATCQHEVCGTCSQEEGSLHRSHLLDVNTNSSLIVMILQGYLNWQSNMIYYIETLYIYIFIIFDKVTRSFKLTNTSIMS